MKICEEELNKLRKDLGIGTGFIKGKDTPVRNCWHFYTDGNAIDAMFYNADDFRDGMNRVYVVWQKFNVVILAFTLMDTHIHFILYGDFESCNKFIREFLRRTSIYLSRYHGESHKLRRLPISYQYIDNDYYLKTAICYTLKNAPVAGLPFQANDYPWSSAPLLFRSHESWAASNLMKDQVNTVGLSWNRKKKVLKSRNPGRTDVKMIDGIVSPDEYVENRIVEELFHSYKGFNNFMILSRESDIESRAGSISQLSLPLQEMREHRTEICKDLYGEKGFKQLNTQQRIRLAKALRKRYNSSPKQIARLCGLKYSEVKDQL